MKYLVIGAGGTGGAIGGFLAKAGKDVTCIARGAHLQAILEKGLTFETVGAGTFTVQPVKACTMEQYGQRCEACQEERPDVIFVCVKGYSLEDTIPFISRVAGADTVVIPVLNIYGTGGRLQEKLIRSAASDGDDKTTVPVVTDGCIYIACEIREPGVLWMNGTIFRVVYGLRRGTPEQVRVKVMPVLEQVKRDLCESGITAVLSEQIEKDALQKFSYVSPMAALGAYYHVQAFAIQARGQLRNTFCALIGEVKALSDAMGVSLPEDIEEINLRILDSLSPTATTSMQRDIDAGKQSELDGLVFEVVRMGKQYGVETPVYEMIAEKFRT